MSHWKINWVASTLIITFDKFATDRLSLVLVLIRIDTGKERENAFCHSELGVY